MSRRRGIHSESQTEEDELETKHQGPRKCCKCDKSDVESSAEHETNNLSRGRTPLYPNLKEAESFLCEECGINARNEDNNLFSVNKIVLITLFIIVLMVAGVVCVKVKNYIFPGAEKPLFDVIIHNQTQAEINFEDELYGLENIYRQQEDRVWYTFSAGIKSVIKENPNKPSVFLLLFDNDGAENTAICLAKDVTRAASKYLMERELEPLKVPGLQLNEERIIKDPGLLMVLFKETVKKNGAMIVTNLENVNPKVASSFHFFCDRYSPLVEKAVYVFTLKLKEIPKGSLQKAAEKALQDLWGKDLPDNVLLPLITRMTGNVLRISNDKSDC